jgi:hypothetical protein
MKMCVTTEFHGVIFHGVHRIYTGKLCAFTLCFSAVKWLKSYLQRKNATQQKLIAALKPIIKQVFFYKKILIYKPSLVFTFATSKIKYEMSPAVAGRIPCGK